jgi:hypothetical protein
MLSKTAETPEIYEAKQRHPQNNRPRPAGLMNRAASVHKRFATAV